MSFLIGILNHPLHAYDLLLVWLVFMRGMETIVNRQETLFHLVDALIGSICSSEVNLVSMVKMFLECTSILVLPPERVISAWCPIKLVGSTLNHGVMTVVLLGENTHVMVSNVLL